MFRRFFTCIARGDVDICTPLTVVRKACTVEEETTRNAWLYHQRNQYIHATDGVPVASLSASLLQKTSAATYRLYQIESNRKLARKFKKCYKFSSSVKAKGTRVKRYPPVKWIFIQFSFCILYFMTEKCRHGVISKTAWKTNAFSLLADYSRSTFLS